MPKDEGPRLLSGGNPQIPKGHGDEVVQSYIAAMPGWKRGIGEWLDALVDEVVPDAHKAVKWNNPLYGIEDRVWFFTYRCFTKYVKVAFFSTEPLDPLPPIDAADPNTRYFHIFEDDQLDEAQLRDWISQAAASPGWLE